MIVIVIVMMVVVVVVMVGDCDDGKTDRQTEKRALCLSSGEHDWPSFYYQHFRFYLPPERVRE